MPDKLEYRSILLGGRRVDYLLERKRVKNLNLRVRPDGSVYVSCPPRVPQRRIDEFLSAEEGRILAALTRREKTEERRPTPERCAEGEHLSVWGRVVTLRVREGKRGALLLGEELILSLPHPGDEAARRRLLDAWQRESCREKLTALCEALYPAFAARGVPRPELRFRRMTSRWGSCLARGGVVTFNVNLCELPESCAVYVAAHELTHFLQPNHSAAFYAELARVLPDWAERRALLRQWE